MKRLLLFSALVGMLFTSTNAQQTYKLTSERVTESGVIYNLPQTVVKIDLDATFTVKKAGPYRQYAPRYLGKVNVIEKDSRSCTLDNAAISSYGLPGSTRYLMAVKPGNALSLTLDADGMLYAINTEPDVTNKENTKANQMPSVPDMDEYLQYVDGDFLASLSDAKKAQMLARSIMEIRESRLALSRGTAETMPVDGRQLELMLESLQKQEDAMMRAFTGYEYSYSESRSVTFTPDSLMADGDRFIIARLSADEGFRVTDDLIGEPIYMNLSNIIAPELPLTPKGEPKPQPKDGIVYCLPAAADFSVSFRGKNYASKPIEYSQQGVTFSLDPKIFIDKKAPYSALFNPSNGALVKLEPKAAQ